MKIRVIGSGCPTCQKLYYLTQQAAKQLGIEPNEVGVAALKAIESDEFECAVGMAQNLVQGAKINFDQFFNNMNH